MKNKPCSITSTSFNCPSGQIIEFDHKNSLVFICIGSGVVSKLIQKASDPVPGIPKEQIATHVAVGGYDGNGKVSIWESHFSTRGARKQTFEEFLQQNNQSTIWAYSYSSISLTITQALTELNLPYGTGDILTNKIASWNKDIAKLRNDSVGLICSELLARSEPYKFIHERVSSWNGGQAPPSWLIQPSHYQRFFLESQAEGVKVR